jgi:signal transduction histidine kinase
MVGTAGYRPGGEGERRRTAYQMAGTVEWVIFAYQSVTLLQTAWINSFSPVYRMLVFGLAAVHAAFAVFVLTRKGLIVRDPRWMGTWIVVAAAVPAAIAFLAPHHAFAANSACVAACTYPAPVLLILSLYPWVFGTLLLQRLAAPALLAALFLEWSALAAAFGVRFTLTTVQSIIVSLLWVSAGYGIGWSLRRITDVWLRNRSDLERQSTENFVNFLHSHIKAGLAAVERECPDVEGMIEKLRDLQDVVSEKRLSLLLSNDQVPLAVVCSERIRVFYGLIDIAESPRIGARTVSQPVGRLFDRSLGDLLKNTTLHGAKTVWIRFSSVPDELVLQVLDDGPGFDADMLNDPGRSLGLLRRSARELGGDLVMRPRAPRGSHLILTLPDAGA